MHISVNLATRPFVELRPFFLRLRIIMAALAVVAMAMMVVTHMMSKKLHAAQAQMDKLRNETIEVQQEKIRNEARMRQPGNAEVLERAHFLNALFLRKSFSWTAVMMDLENVLPTGVQVTSIEPQVTTEGDVIIRLRVSGDRDRAVQLVRNLEHSRRFIAPRLSGESQQAKEPGQNNAPVNPAAPQGVEFDILANYNPLPENEPYRYAKVKSESADAGAPVIKHTNAGSKPAKLPGVVLKPFAGGKR